MGLNDAALDVGCDRGAPVPSRRVGPKGRSPA